MEKPKAYGPFHLTFMIVGFALCIFLAWRLRNIGEKGFHRILLGVGILIDGIFKVIKALEAKAHNLDKWWVVLLLALITCGLGLLLIFDPFGGVELLMTFIGIILIVEGVQNIWVGLYAFRKKTQ